MRIPMLLLACMALALVARAEPPATAKTTATMLGGKIEYTPPEGWHQAEATAKPEEAAAYIANDHDGLMAIQALPSDAAISPDAAQAMVRQLRANHKKAGQEIVLDPKLEKDPRFAIRIHEQFKLKSGKTADELHLYRKVGGRSVMVNAQSLSDDEEHIKGVHTTAEEVLMSAVWVKKK